MSLRILVTGGAAGLGKSIVQYLLARGHSVWVLDKAPESQMHDKFDGALAGYRRVDLGNPEEVLETVRWLTESDAQGFDVLIANASPRIFKYFKDYTEQELFDLTCAGWTAHLIIIHAFLPFMMKKGFGRIICIGSLSGIRGYSTGTVYCGMKSAVIAFHESLQKELAHSGSDVTITTICPDSFSDTQGEPLPQHHRIVHWVLEQIHRSIRIRRSRLLFSGVMRVKFRSAFQYLLKAIRVFE